MNSISGVGIHRSVFKISNTWFVYVNMCMWVLFCVIRWDICIKVLVCLNSKLNLGAFFVENHFYLKEWLTNCAIQTWVILQTFSHKSMNWSCHSRQITDSVSCQWKKFEVPCKNYNFYKTCIYNHGIDIGGEISKYFFYIE